MKNEFNTNEHGAPVSAGPIEIATFASIFNLALILDVCDICNAMRYFFL